MPGGSSRARGGALLRLLRLLASTGWVLLGAAITAGSLELSSPSPPSSNARSPGPPGLLSNKQVWLQLQELYGDGFSKSFRLQLARSSNLNGTTVVAVTVTSAFIDFFENWVCSLRQAGLAIRYLVFALDEGTYDYMTHNGYNAVLCRRPKRAPGTQRQEGGEENGLRFKTGPYYEMIQERNKLIFSAVAAGYNTLVADIDAVWVKDPLRYLHGDDGPLADMGAVVDNPNGWLSKSPSTFGRELCGGFVYFRSCAATKRLLLEVIKRFWMPRYFHNEQKMLSFLIHQRYLRQRPWRWLKVRWLPKPEFPSGKEFFEDYGTAEKAKAVIIHNNYIPTHARKKARFVEHGYWHVEETPPRPEASQFPRFLCNSKA